MMSIALFPRAPDLEGCVEAAFFKFLLGTRTRTQFHILLDQDTNLLPLVSVNLRRQASTLVCTAYWPQAQTVRCGWLDATDKASNNETSLTLRKLRYTFESALLLDSARLYLPEERELFRPFEAGWLPTQNLRKISW